jgi:hypothetical protein
VKALVVEGVNKKAMPTIDSGHCRMLADVMHFMGEAYPMKLATAVRVAWQLSQKKYSRHSDPTRAQLVEFFKDSPKIIEAMSITHPLSSKVMARPTAAALIYVFQKKDAALAGEFAECLIRGKTTPQPFHALRERLIGMRGMHTATKRDMMIHYAIKCWNAARERKKVSHLHIARDEEVPKIL